MNVYLYELDTVNTSEADMKKAEYAMFREIVVNGNTIVLSGNQLIDSSDFWHVVFDDEKYDIIRKLCKIGRIKVSLNKEDGTPIGFLINRVRDRIRYLENNSESGFYFSLFTEIQDRECFLRDLEEAATKNDIRLLRKKYYDVRILRYLEILTELSIEGHYLDNEKSDELYVVVRDTCNKLKQEANLSQDDWKCIDEFVEDCYNKKFDKRSKIKEELNKSGFKDKEQVHLFLDTIVNISYNIVVEKSIPHISRRITNPSDVYNNFKTGYNEKQSVVVSKYYWEKGVSIVERCIELQCFENNVVESIDYKDVISNQRKNWKQLIRKASRKKVWALIRYLIFNGFFFFFVCLVQDQFDVNISNRVYHYIIAALIDLLVNLIMEIKGLQDAADNIKNLSDIIEELKVLYKIRRIEKLHVKSQKNTMERLY